MADNQEAKVEDTPAPQAPQQPAPVEQPKSDEWPDFKYNGSHRGW